MIPVLGLASSEDGLTRPPTFKASLERATAAMARSVVPIRAIAHFEGSHTLSVAPHILPRFISSTDHAVDAIMAERVCFTYDQLLDLRTGAIELLRTIDRHGSISVWESDWWGRWSGKGLPVPVDWDEVPNYEDFIDDFRLRVFKGVKWNAFRGRHGPSNTEARVNRINELQNSIDSDRARLNALGVQLSTPVTTDYTVAFDIPTSLCVPAQPRRSRR
ncbi:hypothetical protein NMY22_g15705 [Coprinellus aureogranulatus]|nr:hypothetical protein NMY22_g15705 [Coprinellus aureogranulatus]